MPRSTLLVVACALPLFSCAGTETAPTADFVPTGAVSGYWGNATFNATRVVGPKVNATLRGDGTWGGTIGSENKALFHTFKDGTLNGPDFLLNISKTGDELTITGQFQGRILRFEANPTKLRVRTDTRSLDYVGDGKGVYQGATTLTLSGDAVSLPPTVPFALALVASFL
ncbi:MAG TPA: hypothetical protein VEJ89_17040 [Myxococcaceae bacterium]|jgi:hypothetical protein|nr:hypothetical protein [Myxococcaceae bacterium]